MKKKKEKIEEKKKKCKILNFNGISANYLISRDYIHSQCIHSLII